MENKKKALITGITGQDGSYLAELLISKGYEVHGLKRRCSSFNTLRIEHLLREHSDDGKFFLHYGDLSDSLNIVRLIKEIQPDEIYNLGAMSHVRVSFDSPEYVADVDGIGTLRILESIRILGLQNKVRFYQASTSELYGLVQETPQKETTPFYPRSPYGCAKLYGYWITVNYRESYNMFACNGILFNHESPRRGETFITRKITRAVCRIKLGIQEKLYVGNIDAKRDWGHAKDYVEGMWKILQQKSPDDYVLATGITTSVRKFIEMAFAELDIEIEWKGKGIEEKGLDKKTGKVLVEIDPQYFRPAEVDLLLGNPEKAKKKLNWTPKYTLSELCHEMVEEDMIEAKREKLCIENGYKPK